MTAIAHAGFAHAFGAPAEFVPGFAPRRSQQVHGLSTIKSPRVREELEGAMRPGERVLALIPGTGFGSVIAALPTRLVIVNVGLPVGDRGTSVTSIDHGQVDTISVGSIGALVSISVNLNAENAVGTEDAWRLPQSILVEHNHLDRYYGDLERMRELAASSPAEALVYRGPAHRMASRFAGAYRTVLPRLRLS